LEVLKKIVSILDMLSQEKSLGTIELANRLDLPKTTVNRILKELTWHGLLEQDMDTKRYRMGWKMIQLSSECLQHEQENYCVPLIRPYLQMLAEETRDTVFLAVIKQSKVICIDKVDGKSNLRFFARVGKELPINCSAPAKVLVAFQTGNIQMDMVENMDFIKCTIDSICEKDKFVEELNSTKLNGYGICNNEIEIGSESVAVPVFDKYGNAFTSIALVGTREHITNDFDRILSSMKRVSHMITQQLNRS